MADAKEAINKILNKEGGYVNDPIDPGGATKYGISSKSHPDIDIESLTISDAISIYKNQYWDKLNLDKIRNQRLANLIMDTAVVCGTAVAHNIMREIADDFYNQQSGEKIDTALAEKIIDDESLRNESAIIMLYKAYRSMYHLNICRQKPSLMRFLRGWLARIDEY